MLRSAGKKAGCAVGGVGRMAHSLAQPAPMQTAIDHQINTALPPLIFPENHDDKNIGVELPNSPFFDGAMELMAVPKKKGLVVSHTFAGSQQFLSPHREDESDGCVCVPRRIVAAFGEARRATRLEVLSYLYCLAIVITSGIDVVRVAIEPHGGQWFTYCPLTVVGALIGNLVVDLLGEEDHRCCWGDEEGHSLGGVDLPLLLGLVITSDIDVVWVAIEQHGVQKFTYCPLTVIESLIGNLDVDLLA
ncbi:hypothetical protein OROGR_003508 [Orobanche gracilis]